MAGLFLVCVPPYTGGGFQPPPPSPRRVGHCRGLSVGTEGDGQGILPVVRHFAYGQAFCLR